MSGQHKLYKNKIRIRDARDSRRLMARVINLFDSDLIDSDRARCFGYLVKCFLKSYEVGELQERVEELEKLAEN